MKVGKRIWGVLALLVFPLILNSKPEVSTYKDVEIGDRIIQLDTANVVHLHDTIVYSLVESKHQLIELRSLSIARYKSKIGLLESGGNYKAINRFGYLGKYQFSKRTLKGLIKLGYLEASPKEIRSFRSNPELQEKAMDALIEHNSDILLNKYNLGKYVGKTINGDKVTLEGMLAAAHLLGPFSVKHYLTNNGSLKTIVVGGVTVRKYDGNNTSIVDYIKHFT